MAVTNKTFADLITFTRSGATATRVNSAGLIETVAADTPRFDYDPVTGAAKGLLIEEARTNLITRATDTDSLESPTGGAYYPNQPIISPLGQANAVLFKEDTGTGLHIIRWAANGDADNAQTTYSFFVKAAGRDRFKLLIFDADNTLNYYSADYDLNTQSASAGTVQGDAVLSASSIEAFGNGWYRVSITGTANTVDGTGGDCLIQMRLLNPSQNYTGDGSSGVYVCGYQAEVGGFPTSLINSQPTFTSRASTATYFDSEGVLQTAAINEARTGYKLINGTWTSMGLLLEAAATNFLIRSEEFDSAGWGNVGSTVTANATTAPDGAATADELIENSGTSGHYINRSATVTASSTLTGSVFVKAASGTRFVYLRASNDGANRFAIFNPSTGEITQEGGVVLSAASESVGGGWYRLQITWVTGGDTNSGFLVGLSNSATGGDLPSYTGDGSSSIYLWGAQIEEGSYATSYIPTEGSTVTRSADVSSSSTVTRPADSASITGTNFSDWYNASEGTVYVDADLTNASGTDYLVQIASPTVAQGISYWVNNNPTDARFWTGGSNIVISGSQPLGAFKVAFAFKDGDNGVSWNGSTANTNSATPPTDCDKLKFSANQNSFIHIKDIRFYPTRLSNAQLQDLTS